MTLTTLELVLYAPHLPLGKGSQQLNQALIVVDLLILPTKEGPHRSLNSYPGLPSFIKYAIAKKKDCAFIRLCLIFLPFLFVVFFLSSHRYMSCSLTCALPTLQERSLKRLQINYFLSTDHLLSGLTLRS